MHCYLGDLLCSVGLWVGAVPSIAPHRLPSFGICILILGKLIYPCLRHRSIVLSHWIGATITMPTLREESVYRALPLETIPNKEETKTWRLHRIMRFGCKVWAG
mmetsp:Transcript_12164/g.28168  ORF Transcript_12164/g.28168 Transcript_12164/m.28168 type:complete len:104 (+) Transcript_12164:1133-1444(+)